jgi:DNA-binding Lrp family transcriptional regulator
MTIKVFLAAKAESDHGTDIIAKLESREPVKEIYLIQSGTYDVIALIEVDSLDGYRGFIDEIAHLEDIVDFESFIRTDSD